MNRSALCNWVVILGTCGFSFAGFRDRGLEEKFIFWPRAILGGRQYYRLLTSGFLHADVWHLGMNMLSLYFFGPGIEARWGAAQFLVIYFAAIVGGNLLSLLVHRHHDYRAYGASGGVSGIILASIFLFPGGRIGVFPIPIGIPSWFYAVVFLAASFYGMKNQIGNVGHDAHLGGALVGFYTAAALHPPSSGKARSSLRRSRLAPSCCFYIWRRTRCFCRRAEFHFASQAPAPAPRPAGVQTNRAAN